MARPSCRRPKYAASVVLTCIAAATLGSSALAAPANVRLNDMTFKSSQTPTDATAALAVAGMQVVAVWNRGSTYSQFAYSSDGGRSFTDGGELRVPNYRNFGDAAIATDRAGNFYTATSDADVTDMENTRGALYVRHGSFAGHQFRWDPPVAVMGPVTGTGFGNMALAADPNDGTVYLAFVQGTLLGFTTSPDHGVTWTARRLLAQTTSPSTLNGVRLVVGPDGEVVLLYVDRDPLSGRHSIIVRRSTNHGASFSAPSGVAAPDGPMSNLSSGPPGYNLGSSPFEPSLAVDPGPGPHRGRIYVAWEAGLDTRFDVLGAAGTASEVEPNGAPTSASPYTVGTTASGSIASTTDVDWYRFDGVAGRTLVARLGRVDGLGVAALTLYGGAGGNADRLAYSSIGIRGTQIVFTLPSSGTYWLAVTYAGGGASGYELQSNWHTRVPNEFGRDSRDIALLWSDDGVQWAPRPTIVNDDEPRFDNAMPEVAVDGAGQVHVIWYDHRDDPSRGRITHVYHAVSSDGGATFAANQRVDDGRGTNFAAVPTWFAPNMGKRLALVSDGCRALAAFADGRSGYTDAWTQVLYGAPSSVGSILVSQAADTTGAGSPARFVAAVRPADAAASVQFMVDGSPAGEPVAVDALTSEAIWVTDVLTPGSHAVGARYLGTPCIQPADASPVTHVVAGELTLYTLTVDLAGNGTVVRVPDRTQLPKGTEVKLFATPAPGWRFAGWSGAAAGTADSAVVTMDADRQVQASFIALPVATYRWAPPGTATSFGAADNWTPARTSPAATDVLVFDNNVANPVFIFGDHAVGAIVLRGATEVLFDGGVNRGSVTLSGAEPQQLVVEAGARLRLGGSGGTTLTLPSLAHGSVSGRLEVTGGPHRILVADEDALRFHAGASVLAGAGFSGSLFGTGNAPSGLNSVVFESGSLYVQAAGGDPFGANVPASVVRFEPGSRFRLNSPTGASIAGRTYADFEHDIGGTTTVSGSRDVSCDSLIVTRGTVRLAQSGATRLRGDLRVRAGATLEVVPAVGGTQVSFEGTAPQRSWIDGTLTLSRAASWRFANPAGFQLTSDWTPGNDLFFAGGRVDTPPYRLHLPDTVFTYNASAENGWVNGTITRKVPLGPSSHILHLGDAFHFAPVSVRLSDVTGEGELNVRTSAGDHPQLGLTDLAADRTVNRVWTMECTAEVPAGLSGATFGYTDPELDPAAARATLLCRRWTGTQWEAESTAVLFSNEVQVFGLRGFGDFVLGNLPRPIVEPPPAPGPDFAISAVVPNPVRDHAVVTLDLPRAAPVRLQLFDLQGRLVSTLFEGPLDAGRRTFDWRVGSSGQRAAGLLFLRLEAPGVSRQRRIVLAR